MEVDEKKPVEETEVVKDEIIVDEEQSEELEGSEEDQSENDPDTDESEESETIILIDDKEPEEKEEAPQWVKDVRKKNRELEKEVKTLRKQVDSTPKHDDPGKKPTLEDFDYESDQYEAAYDKWIEKKHNFESNVKAQKDQESKEEETFKTKVDSYQKQKLELKFDDVEESEQIVHDILTPNQIGSIVNYRDNPALVFYALGKNPKKAKELSEITDPIKFAIAVENLEKKLKVSQRKPATTPERKVSGSGPVMTAGDKELTRLRNEADKTGDRSKVLAYRTKQREKQA